MHTLPNRTPSSGGTSRRAFLQIGALGALGYSMSRLAQPERGEGMAACGTGACILIFNLGGPSQLDTFDPKPEAPSEIRSPFAPITVKGGGFQISELLPRHAKVGDHFSLIRSVCHDESALHETGAQLTQTGERSPGGLCAPPIGFAIDYLSGSQNGLPAHVVLPEPFPACNAELKMEDPRVRDAFNLDREPLAMHERYGRHRFGQSCLLARRLVERGVRFVTLNTFQSVFHHETWDIHGSRPFTTLSGLRDVVAPMYDQGYSALISDLAQRGLLDSTMVAALAEFGRTPQINAAGGRDHWTHCWSVALAGGGVQGGRVIGQSDARGAYPVDRPVHPREILATIYHSMGVDTRNCLRDATGASVPLVSPGSQPILELFA